LEIENRKDIYMDETEGLGRVPKEFVFKTYKIEKWEKKIIFYKSTRFLD